MRALPVLTATALLLAYGVAEGLWTGRWGASPELEHAAARLAALPLEVGPWQGREEVLDPRQVRRAEVHAHVLRRYTHRTTGETLTVLAVCGRPGPVAAHTPEVCYGGAGYGLISPAVRKSIQTSGQADFWAGHFVQTSGIPESLQIYWSWNAGGGWEAVTDARWTFASRRALYKIYVVRRTMRPDEPASEDPIPGFLELFLPEAGRCLFPGS